MVIYKLFNFGPTRIVEFQGKGFTFTHNMSWETKDENQARYITLHYPKIDLVDVKNEEEEKPLVSAKKLDLSKLTMKQLRQLAKERNVKVPKNVRKKDLVKLLNKK